MFDILLCVNLDHNKGRTKEKILNWILQFLFLLQFFSWGKVTLKFTYFEMDHLDIAI